MHGRTDEAWSVIAWIVAAKKLRDTRNPVAALLCVFAAGAAFAEFMTYQRGRLT